MYLSNICLSCYLHVKLLKFLYFIHCFHVTELQISEFSWELWCTRRIMLWPHILSYFATAVLTNFTKYVFHKKQNYPKIIINLSYLTLWQYVLMLFLSFFFFLFKKYTNYNIMLYCFMWMSKYDKTYHIYPAIRRGFAPLEWLQITTSVQWNFAIIPMLPFLNNPKDLDPSYKTNLDLWDCFGRKKLHLITEEMR